MGFLLIRLVGALPIWLAIAVILHPPNSAPFLEVDTAGASRSCHSIHLFCGHSSVIAALETRMNTGETKAQRIWNAMRGPQQEVPKEAGITPEPPQAEIGEIFPARFKLSSRGVAFD